MSLYARFFADLDAMLDALAAEGVIPADAKRNGITLEPPRDPSHGDLSTNAAMVLAKQARTNPRALAEQIVPKLEAHVDVESVEVAGPGFINIRLARGAWERELEAILEEGTAYGKSTIGKGETVNVEYVSANPTGPMHMGHSRGAVVGDALARLLEAAGYDVVKEYYVNDAGAQVDTLARSAHLRYREALGEEIGEIPEGLYPGGYLVPVGQAFAQEFGEKYKDAPESEWLQLFKEKAAAAMMDLVRKDLALLGVEHDAFASEAELQASGQVDAAMDALRAKGLVYEGVLEPPKGQKPDDWEPVELTLFKSSEFGDDQDRPMKKSDGSWTYFGADAAYHRSKVEGWASGRKADHLVNIWGADHAGTVKRVQSAVTALTDGKVDLDVKLVQMVQLMKGGKPFKMSKRAGNFVTLADVVEMVGKDVVRFTMLTRKPDAQMDFDFDKVVEASKDNPVFYVQYAHARISSVMRRVKSENIEVGEPDVSRLGEGDLALIKQAANFPRVVEQAALAHEPHRIAFYLYDLAAAFHAGWNRGNDDPQQRFIVEGDPQLTAARLELARGIGQVIRNGLAIMGVEAAEEMR